MLGLTGQKKHVKRMVIAVIAMLVVLGSGTGIAAAAGVVTLSFSGNGNITNGCYSPAGQLKVLTEHYTTCPNGMTPIHWNVVGPQGATGPQGPQGATRP